MYDMKMKSSRELKCEPCEEEEEERYPCVYLDVPQAMVKALKGISIGDSVEVTMKAKVKALSLKDPKTSYNGSGGSLDFEVVKLDLKSSGTVFGETAEDDD
jgi:acyl-CoA hydrolase